MSFSVSQLALFSAAWQVVGMMSEVADVVVLAEPVTFVSSIVTVPSIVRSISNFAPGQS